MRAIVQVGIGGPEVLQLQDVPKPEVKRGHLLVRVKAIGTNYIDTMIRRGWFPMPQRQPYIPGIEVSGIVEAVGEGVENWQVGQRVMAGGVSGAYAEYCLVPVELSIPVPSNLSDEEAAAVPVNWITAYIGMVSTGKLKQGETVLIHAAAGGVGTAAVQIAKQLGATVFATAGSDEKVEFVRSLGADVAINYERENFEEAVMERTNGRGVDLVMECVGGNVFTMSVRCLAQGGRLVMYGYASGNEGIISSRELYRRRGTVTVISRTEEAVREAVERILEWLNDGKVKPIVGETHPLENAGLAQFRLETRQTKGKVVLVP